jgi:hypothetical protein
MAAACAYTDKRQSVSIAINEFWFKTIFDGRELTPRRNSRAPGGPKFVAPLSRNSFPNAMTNSICTCHKPEAEFRDCGGVLLISIWPKNDVMSKIDRFAFR